ncbi:hypothetical protein [Providencia sp. PROV156]|uniref:hypothetical protein n=1 Tax=Providencia sp. PROV156 TaxID=2949866 RepID=UPI002349EA17|nr:hypothetical protein [Providencia sp. PROV156]
MATIIDALIVTLRLDNTGFKEETRKSTAESDRLSASLDNVNESSADLTITIKNQADETKKAKEKTEDFTRSMYNGVKALTAFFGTIMVSSGLAKLITDVNQANDKLNFLSKNLGMNATEVKKWQNMAEMAGGTADGMTASLSNLSKSLWDLVTIGDASVLPYFNALNVGVVDSTGNIRNLDDILLDVADSLSKMSRPQAYNIAKNMGFDEGTINTLLQGRDAMERQLIAQKNIVISSQEELEISRKLNEQNALVSQQWEGLKTLIANYLIPYFLKFSERLTAWLDYLNRNRDGAILIFKGIAAIIGLTLIPLALKAAIAFAGMFAPLLTGVGLILALGAAIIGLSNDYEVWKRGGKSMFDWSEWSASIETVLGWLDQISKWFKDTKIGKWFTDQEGNLNKWELALAAFATYFGGKWVVGILSGFGKLSLGFARLLGWPGLLVAAFVTAIPIIKSYIDEAAEHFGDVMAKAGEKASLVVAAVHKFNDPNATTEDKVIAGAKALDGVIPGAGVLALGKDGVKNVIENLSKPFLNSGSSSGFTASGVEVPNEDKRIYKTENGDVIREGGSRAWRNNNPSNMIWGKAAQSLGAIGHDTNAQGHTMAIFPNKEMGDKARQWMLFESNWAKQLSTKGDYGAGLGYKDKTVSQAITSHSPPEYNNTAAYISEALAAIGGQDKRMGDLTTDERKQLIAVIDKKEGWDVGKEYSLNAKKTLDYIKSLDDQMTNKPVPHSVAIDINRTLATSDNLRSNSQLATNNRVEATFGDINITTSSPTVQGSLSDVLETTNEMMFQLIAPMS